MERSPAVRRADSKRILEGLHRDRACGKIRKKPEDRWEAVL